ncbi:MAG: glycosyltransferase family 39 protein [Planctomycetaceae bacterium]
MIPLIIILGTHAGLLIYSARIHSPALDEVAHLPAGLSCWERGRLGLYPVNPPLIRCLAALPVWKLNPETDWTADVSLPGVRVEFDVGRDFVRANGQNVELYFEVARLALVPISVVGGWVCYCWSADLFGWRSGLCSALLWSFSPTVLGNAALITPDAGSAVAGVLAGYGFWRWTVAPSWPRVVVAGLLLGIALLCKMTSLVFLGIWPSLWFVCARLGPTRLRSVGTGLQIVSMLCLALLVLNLGYGFRGTGIPLGEHHFSSRMLNGCESDAAAGLLGNRFRGTWLGRIPLPFPTDYLIGLDLQKRDFERGMWSYLAGEHRLGGWWYFYLYALAVKVPVGTWLLMGIAVVVYATQPRGAALTEWHLLLPPLVILTLVSWHFSISRYLRYLLPAFPYVFIWISRVGCLWDGPDPSGSPMGWHRAGWRLAMSLSLGACVTSSLAVFPHSLSYFNLLAGGPQNGHAHLIDASIDWGQDLKLLRSWLDRQPQVQPLFLDVYTALDPRWLGIAYQRVPPSQREHEETSVVVDRSRSAHSDRTVPAGLRPPGWYALSVHRLRDRNGRFDDFLKRKPFCRIGYSIYIYRVDRESWPAPRPVERRDTSWKQTPGNNRA